MDSDFSTPYIVLPVADLVEGPRGPAPFILSKKARIVEGRKAGGASDKNQAPPYLTINPVKIIDPDRE